MLLTFDFLPADQVPQFPQTDPATRGQQTEQARERKRTCRARQPLVHRFLLAARTHRAYELTGSGEKDREAFVGRRVETIRVLICSPPCVPENCQEWSG